jgi:transmembrane sensor
MATRDFRRALSEAARVLSRAPVPASVDRRLRARLFGVRARGRPWILAAGALSAAAAAVLAAVLWPGDVPQAPEPRIGGFALLEAGEGAEVRTLADDSVEVRGGRGLLRAESAGATLLVAPGAVVRREARGLRVVRGAVGILVEKRVSDAPPARVLVSHGVIEVLGTAFTVVQRDDGGEVSLHEGTIRFVGADGSSAVLAPGERLAWPRAREVRVPAPPPAPPPQRRPPRRRASRPEPPPAAPAEAPARRPPEAVALLARIDELRSRGRYADAADELSRALEGDWRPATRERLSFELGALLTYQVGDRLRACAHWRRHRARFGAGRYEDEVERAWERLGCGDGE